MYLYLKLMMILDQKQLRVDSFNAYVLLDEIENTFNVKFNLNETLDIKNVGDFKKLLKKHGVV